MLMSARLFETTIGYHITYRGSSGGAAFHTAVADAADNRHEAGEVEDAVAADGFLLRIGAVRDGSARHDLGGSIGRTGNSGHGGGHGGGEDSDDGGELHFDWRLR